MNGRLTRDRLFIRLANDGTPIANSAIWRKSKPAGSGKWKDITNCVIGCCDAQNSFIIFQRSTGSSAFTEISFNGYDFTGTIDNGSFLAVPLPFNSERAVTVTVSSFSGRTLTTSVIQGDGTIDAVGSLAALSTTFNVSATPGSQYLVVLS